MTARSVGLFAFALLGFAVGCGGDPAEQPKSERQALLDDTVVEMGAPGGVLAIVDPDGQTWIGATGMADVDAQIPMQTVDRFGIGSITKTFTGAVTLQLVEEGVLSLDDPLSTYAVEFPRADEILLRHLLTHTSGIYDYAYDSEVLAGHARKWEPEELLALAAVHELEFDPGDDWSYSNTNFILVGLVIEAATGNSWAHEVRTRLLDPFDLQDTFIATDEDVPGAARGYFGDDDWTLELDPSTGWAAGGIVSNATDLLKWLDLLIHGDVLTEASRDAMRTPATLNDGTLRGYGIAMRLRSTDQFGSFTKIGHGGDAIIYRSDLFHIPESGHTVVALVNGFPHQANTIADRAWSTLLPPVEE